MEFSCRKHMRLYQCFQHQTGGGSPNTQVLTTLNMIFNVINSICLAQYYF